MGTGSDILDIVGRLRRDGYFMSPDRSVAEIGAQQLANSFLRATDQVAELGLLFGVDRPLQMAPAAPSSIIHGFEQLDRSVAPLAREFWLWLGFTYAAIDVDDSPDAVPLDLNVDSLPQGMRNAFDLVTNLGTTEHVVNQWNAFRIAHDLTKPGGLMIHNLPCQGYFTHGLVNYTPKFFWYLARSNNYTALEMDLTTFPESYAVPADVLAGVRVIGVDPGSYHVHDASLRVILRKNTEAEFFPPIDVPTGAGTQLPDLRHRYAPVFDPDGETRTRMEFRVGELGAELTQARAELDEARAQCEQARAQLATSCRQLEGARQALGDTQQQIAAARASISWRITAPFRRVRRIFSPRS